MLDLYTGLFQLDHSFLNLDSGSSFKADIDDTLFSSREGFRVQLDLTFLSFDAWVISTPVVHPEHKNLDRRDYLILAEIDKKYWLLATSELVDSVEQLPVEPNPHYLSEFGAQPAWFEELSKKIHLGMGLQLSETLDGDSEGLLEAIKVRDRFGPLVTVHTEMSDFQKERLSQHLKRALRFPFYLRFVNSESTSLDALPPTHTVRPETIRLFAKSPELGIGRDGLRHKASSLQGVLDNIEDSKDNPETFLDGNFRFEFSGDVYSRLRAVLPFIRLQYQRTILEPGSFGSEAPTTDQAESEKVRQLQLGIDSEKKLVDQLSGQLAELQYEFDFQGLEVVELAKEISQLEGKRVYLNQQLAALHFYSTDGEIEEDPFWSQTPNYFEEMLERIQPLDSMSFTGKYTYVKQLDSQPNREAGLIRAWGALRAMDSYATLKSSGDYKGSLFDYLSDPAVVTYKAPSGYFAAKESESVKNNPVLHQARIFKVPDYVRPDEVSYMEAHVKIMVSNALAPRMHFLDDTSNSGKLWIGYLGPHLPL